MTKTEKAIAWSTPRDHKRIFKLVMASWHYRQQKDLPGWSLQTLFRLEENIYQACAAHAKRKRKP